MLTEISTNVLTEISTNVGSDQAQGGGRADPDGGVEHGCARTKPLACAEEDRLGPGRPSPLRTTSPSLPARGPRLPAGPAGGQGSGSGGPTLRRSTGLCSPPRRGLLAPAVSLCSLELLGPTLRRPRSLPPVRIAHRMLEASCASGKLRTAPHIQ